MAEVGGVQEVINQAEKLRNELRFADQGYSGFFDLVKIDKQENLDAVYQHDQDLVGRIETLVEQKTMTMTQLRQALRELQQAVADRRTAILTAARN
jgi:hypothetical protein